MARTPVAHPLRTIWMLAAISALGSMAIHMMVPALPLLARDFAITAHTAQQVIFFYLLGLGGGQLLAGPIADRIGRRPVLLAGLAVYALAALLGAFASGPTPLLAARLLQAFGASAGLVTSRAMVGDLFAPEEAGRRQATLMGVVLMSPAIAPVLGGFIAALSGWRAILALLAAVGLVAIFGVARSLPESLPRRGERQGAIGLGAAYRRLLHNRRFIRTVATIAASSSALYMFLSAAPFLLIENWRLTPEQAGFCFLAVAAASIGGTMLVRHIEGRANVLRVGVSLSLTGALASLALALAGYAGVAALIGPMLLLGLGAGIAAPAGMATVVHAEPGLSGTAASLAGATQMLVSALASSVLGLAGPPSFLLLASGVSIATLAAFTACPAIPHPQDC